MFQALATTTLRRDQPQQLPLMVSVVVLEEVLVVQLSILQVPEPISFHLAFKTFPISFSQTEHQISSTYEGAIHEEYFKILTLLLLKMSSKPKCIIPFQLYLLASDKKTA